MNKKTKLKFKARITGALLVFLVLPMVLNLIPGFQNVPFNIFRIDPASANPFTDALSKVGDSVTGAVTGAFVSMAEYVATGILMVIAMILTAIIKLLGGIIYLLLKINGIIIGYNGFIHASVVQKGWVLVRDLGNMFFILIILAIAIATILRVESYNIKKLLPKVIIMAVLVNFSLMICGLIIDFAQVILMTFSANIVQNSEAFVGLFKFSDMMKAGADAAFEGVNTTPADYLDVVIAAAFAIILLVVAIVVIFIMMMIFLMRIIMLWILIVLSPLAFVLSAFPQGQKYASQWWATFAKYVIVGPVLAFFLWLTFAIVSPGTGSISHTEILQDGGTPQDIVSSAGNANIFNQIASPEDFLSFIIAIAMLVGGLMAAQQAGVAGGQLAAGSLSKMKSVAKSPLALGKFGLKEAGSLISRRAAKLSQKGGAWRAAALLSPKTIKEGFAAAKGEAEQAAYPVATGGVQDFVNRYNPLVRRKTQHQRRAFRGLIAQHQSDLNAQNFSEMELGAEFENEFGSKSVDPARLNAIMRQQVMNKQEDDHEVGVRETTGGGEYGPEQQMLKRYERLKERVGEEMANEIFGDLTDIGEAAQKTRAMNMVTQRYDPETGEVIKQVNVKPALAEKEMTTRMDRAELQRLLPGLEGKFLRRTVAKKRKMLNPFSNKEFESGMTNFDSFGVANWRSVPKKLADVVEKRGHSLAERVKETIGFNDVVNEETGKKEARLTSVGGLVDAFKGNPEVAGSILANMKLEDDQLETVHAILTSDSAKNAGVDQSKVTEVFKDKKLEEHTTQNNMTSEEKEFVRRLQDGGDLKFKREKLPEQAFDEDGNLEEGWEGYNPTILAKVNAQTGQVEEGYGNVRELEDISREESSDNGEGSPAPSGDQGSSTPEDFPVSESEATVQESATEVEDSIPELKPGETMDDDKIEQLGRAMNHLAENLDSLSTDLRANSSKTTSGLSSEDINGLIKKLQQAMQNADRDLSGSSHQDQSNFIHVLKQILKSINAKNKSGGGSQDVNPPEIKIPGFDDENK